MSISTTLQVCTVAVYIQVTHIVTHTVDEQHNFTYLHNDGLHVNHTVDQQHSFKALSSPTPINTAMYWVWCFFTNIYNPPIGYFHSVYELQRSPPIQYTDRVT